MAVVAVQVFISSSVFSLWANQMFCIKMVIWQLTNKDEEESLSHAIKQQPRETGSSLRINLTFWSQLQLSDEPKVQVVPLKHVGFTAMTWWNHPNWKYSHPCSSVCTSGPLFCSVLFCSVLFCSLPSVSNHYWSSDTTADQKNSKSPIC